MNRITLTLLGLSAIAAPVAYSQEAADFPIATWQAPRYYQTTDFAVSKTGERTALPSGRLEFIAVAPCRVMDTRGPNGTFGGPILAGGQVRTVPIPTSGCGIPSTAQAFSVNFTVVPTGFLGYLSAWPTGNRPNPDVSILNSLGGDIIANSAIVPAGTNSAIDIFGTNATHVIIDINGYYVPQFPRTVGGYVTATGSASDNGFTVVKGAAGVYTINYDLAFAGPPNISITANGASTIVAPTSISSGSSSCTFTMRNAAGTAQNEDFWFTAIQR